MCCGVHSYLQVCICICIRIGLHVWLEDHCIHCLVLQHVNPLIDLGLHHKS